MKAAKVEMASSSISQKLPSERIFGFMFTIILAGVGIYGFLKGWDSRIVSAFIGAYLILGIISVLIPKILVPFNVAWFHLGELLGKIITPIVLGVIFFGLLTPSIAGTNGWTRRIEN